MADTFKFLLLNPLNDGFTFLIDICNEITLTLTKT